MRVEQTLTKVLSGRTQKALALLDHYDLVLLVNLALLFPVLVLLPIPLLRVPLGLAIVLLAPGYALTAALFARRGDLDRLTRAALSLGLSVALLPVLALVLDVLPWGIRLWPMVISLSIWLIILSGVVALRRYSLRRLGEAALPPRIDLATRWQTLIHQKRLGHAPGLLCGASLLVCGFAVFLISDSSVRLTEFYALGAEGMAENYPQEVAPGEEMQVRLGITNRQGKTMIYRVEVRSGTARLAGVGPITVADGITWEQPLRFALAAAGDDQVIDIILFQDDESLPYRQLRLWVNVREKMP